MKTRELTFGPLIASLLITSAAFAADIYTGGHGDIGVSYIDNELVFRYELGSSAIVNGSPLGTVTQFAPDEIITQAGPTAYEEITSPLTSYFPDKTHGYFFGANSSSTTPYLGFGADDPTIGGGWGPGPHGLPAINYSIAGVTYTGAALDPQILYYSLGPFGEIYTLYDHLGDATVPNIPLPVGAHSHATWGFSDPGIYDVTWSANGTHVIDGFKQTTGTFRFEILPVPEPASITLGVLGLLALTLACRRFRRQVSA